MKKKLFKDPIIRQISCREFYEISNFLYDCKDYNDLDNIKGPLKNQFWGYYYYAVDVYYK